MSGKRFHSLNFKFFVLSRFYILLMLGAFQLNHMLNYKLSHICCRYTWLSLLFLGWPFAKWWPRFANRWGQFAWPWVWTGGIRAKTSWQSCPSCCRPTGGALIAYTTGKLLWIYWRKIWIFFFLCPFFFCYFSFNLYLYAACLKINLILNIIFI